MSKIRGIKWNNISNKLDELFENPYVKLGFWLAALILFLCIKTSTIMLVIFWSIVIFILVKIGIASANCYADQYSRRGIKAAA